MTDTPKRGRGRPRKLPATQDQTLEAKPAPAAPVAQAAPAGLSTPPPPVAAPMPAPPRTDDMRGDMRAEDPRAEAERIAAEWFGHLDTLGPQKDKYAIDPSEIPDGWSYEWRTYTVIGKENPQYQVQLQRSGWRPVPAKRHPQLLPKNSTDQVILIDGMMLMERPAKITEFQRARDQQAARAPIDNIRAKLTGVPQGQFARGTDGAPAKVASQFAPLATEVHKGRVTG